MEEAIRRKIQIIKDIEEEIKLLKNGTYFDNKKNAESSTLVFDIVSKKENLINVQKIYSAKIK